jgi:hypothetical protein
MMEPEPTFKSSPRSQASSGVGGNSTCGAEGPTAEETAAIVTVLALLQTDATPEAEPPGMSAWARAGRREAARPWTKQE